MSQNIHFYKSYEIRNMTKVLKRDNRVFHIIPDCGRSGDTPIDATSTFRSAKNLIDVWEESTTCACGRDPLPHHYQCSACITRRLLRVRRLRLVRKQAQ
jgi:hypothetical protein